MSLPVPDSAASQDDRSRPDVREKPPNVPNNSPVTNGALIIVLLVTCYLAYKSIVFNWFSGDDFVHLCWLTRAANDPQLVLHNFYANWLDAFGSAFYRPLISVSLYFDYLVWHNNGFGFHLTNLAFHFMSVIFIYLFVEEIQVASARKRDQKLAKNPALASTWSLHSPPTLIPPASKYLWPFFATGLFALHPIHPEVVSWIIGRVDSVATAFVMVCLYFYARWRSTNSVAALLCGMAAMILALCSKEIAVLLAPVVTMYELCLGPSDLSGSLISRLKALKPLLAFWLLLVGYFIVRQLALGTWLGGYDNTLGLGIPFYEWLAQTWHGCMIVLVPVNADVLSKSNALIRIWSWGSSLCAIVLVSLFVRGKFLREIIFCSAFAVLALLPVYKIFYVLTVNLDGSRYAYLLTVPICMLLGLAISQIPLPQKLGGTPILATRTTIGITLLVSAFGLLQANNTPWHEAGVTVNGILIGLQRILGPSRASVPANVVLVGPPDAYRGAYICRNAIDFMMQQLNIVPPRAAGVVNILDRQKVFPMSNIRNLMEHHPKDIEIWHWKNDKKIFVPVKPIVELEQGERVWTAAQALPSLKNIPTNLGKVLRWNHDELFIDSKNSPVVVYADFKQCPTWGMSFLAMTVRRAADCPKDVQPSIAIPADHGNVYIAAMPLAHADEFTQTLVFPLRSIPAWTLDYTSVPLLPIIFSNGWRGELLNFKSIPPVDIMPATSVKCFGGGNFYRLWKKFPEGTLEVDVTGIKGATGWALEVIPTLDQFSQGNPTAPELNAKITKFPGTHARHKLHLHDLPEGFYCIRAWALDKNSHYVGAGSDHYRIQFKD